MTLGMQALEQSLRILRTLPGRQFQPMPRLLGILRKAQTGVFELGKSIPSPRCLTQQLVADASVACIAAIAAQQLSQATLGNHHAPTRRLFEQASGQVLDAGLDAQAGAVE